MQSRTDWMLLTEAIHAHDCRVFIQLHHYGAKSAPTASGAPWAPSEIPALPGGKPGHAMTVEEIKIEQKRFIDAAVRAKQSGFDGVELAGTHGYLLHQFMSQLSGREAATMHRLLGARMEDGSDLVHFAKNEDDPLNCDAVILDECSMVDLLLLAALVRAVPQDARLILVGDCDQLPPVGPGKVFRGMIESGIFPTVKFTEIFRQSEGSLIVKNAHLINDGKIPDFSDNKADFFRLKRLEEASAVETITELCAVRLPNRMHIAPEEIQVL